MSLLCKFKGLLFLTVAVILLNTVAFAATTLSSSTTNCSVYCNMTDFNSSDETITKTRDYGAAFLSNLSGASVSFGYAFNVYVARPGYTTTYYTETQNYTYQTTSYMELKYNNYIVDKKYAVYAKLYGTPRSYPTTMECFLTP